MQVKEQRLHSKRADARFEAKQQDFATKKSTPVLWLLQNGMGYQRKKCNTPTLFNNLLLVTFASFLTPFAVCFIDAEICVPTAPLAFAQMGLKRGLPQLLPSVCNDRAEFAFRPFCTNMTARYSVQPHFVLLAFSLARNQGARDSRSDSHKDC